MTIDRQANVLGALALVLTDQTAHSVAAAAGQSISAAAALSALHQFLDRPTLDQLRSRYLAQHAPEADEPTSTAGVGAVDQTVNSESGSDR